MNSQNLYVKEFIKSEFKSSGIHVAQNKNGREGVGFILTANNGGIHDLFLQTIDLDKERSIKIPKQDLGALDDKSLGCIGISD